MSNNPVLFTAVGDITLGDHPMCAGFGAHSRFIKESPVFPFEHVKEVFHKSDLTFGNLECTHSNLDLQKDDLGSIQMRGSPVQIPGLAEAGIDIVNVANNHTMQHGKEAFLDSIKNLEMNGIKHFGDNPEDHLVGKPAIVEKNGLKIAFLGYSLRPRQYFEYEPYYTEGTKEGILADIERVKPEADLIVISLHWGDEFIRRPSPMEIHLARQIIDSGADLIIGHHPHVLKGIEKYKKAYIVYSLGNFICDMAWDNSLTNSLIFQCHFTKNGIQDINLIPAWINQNYQPEILADRNAKLLLNEIKTLSEDIEQENLDGIEEKNKIYIKDADLAQQKNRKQCHRYFLFRIWKFLVAIVIQQFAKFFSNRVHELVHGHR